MDSCDSTGRSTPFGGASVMECANIHGIWAIEYTTAVREVLPDCVV